MAENPERQRQAIGTVLTAAVLLIVFSYLLIPGPLVWMADREYLPRSVVHTLEETVYVPLMWVIKNNESVRDTYVEYLNWWRH